MFHGHQINFKLFLKVVIFDISKQFFKSTNKYFKSLIETQTKTSV